MKTGRSQLNSDTMSLLFITIKFTYYQSMPAHKLPKGEEEKGL